jgi:SAM-dependent methyltransferase
MNNIKQFWDQQAEQYGGSSCATSPDHHYRELEIRRILPWLKNCNFILDVGCGNGYSTFKFADKYPDAHILGIDYSEAMISTAKAIRGKRSRPWFMVGDVRDSLEQSYKYNAIVTERCLINLASWEEQQAAILNLKSVLRRGGRLILVENMINGLNSLNRLRDLVDLPTIPERWHNLYMELSDTLDFLGRHFTIRAVHNIGNLYYILSRVLYAKIAAMQGKEPRYDHPINAIASMLPSFVNGRYSPNYLIVCEVP